MNTVTKLGRRSQMEYFKLLIPILVAVFLLIIIPLSSVIGLAFTNFSFVTMTTLGYGDISPVSPAARTLAWMQALVGQLYLAITIAGLVGIHIARQKD